MRNRAEIAAAYSLLAKSDPLRAFKLAPPYLGLSSERDEARNAVLRTWAESDPEGMLAHLLTLENQNNMGVAFSELWTARDPVGAFSNLAMLEQLGTGEHARNIRLGMIHAWMKQGDEAYGKALEWVAENTTGDRQEQLRHEFHAQRAGQLGCKQAVEFILEKGGNEELQKSLRKGFETWAKSDPKAAVEQLIAAMPESPQRERAVQLLTNGWMSEDPVALSEWLTGLEPSSSRDAAVAQFVRLLKETDPARAQAWAETITDPRWDP